MFLVGLVTAAESNRRRSSFSVDARQLTKHTEITHAAAPGRLGEEHGNLQVADLGLS
jgi:hypothetical protein